MPKTLTDEEADTVAALARADAIVMDAYEDLTGSTIGGKRLTVLHPAIRLLASQLLASQGILAIERLDIYAEAQDRGSFDEGDA